MTSRQPHANRGANQPAARPSHVIYVRRRLVLGGMLVAIVTAVALGTVATRSTTRPPRSAKARPTEGPVVLQATDASWSLPMPLSRTVALPAGSQLRVLGGLRRGSTTTGDIVTIDPQTGQATPTGSLADPVHDAAGAILGHRSIVFGGGARTVVATVQGMDIATPSGRADRLGRLPAPRADLATASVGDRAVLVGGYDGTAWNRDVLATIDGVTFSVVARLIQGVRYPSVAAIGTRVYILGGEPAVGRGNDSAIQVVDVDVGTATIGGQIPGGLSHAGAAVIGDSIYVFGGRSGGHAIDTISTLDPSTMTLKTVGHLPRPVSDMAVVTLANRAYLLGGEDDSHQPTGSVVVVKLAPAGHTTSH